MVSNYCAKAHGLGGICPGFSLSGFGGDLYQRGRGEWDWIRGRQDSVPAPASFALAGPCVRKEMSPAMFWARPAEGMWPPQGLMRSREDRHDPAPWSFQTLAGDGPLLL